ncbi:MAG: hypothetical protein J7M29_11560 [Verrucomicrobia bacterium]|nr:hypothetical protein [Verrucomicrobiota bacterium]
MIQLRTDYLVFKTPEGFVPCSAEAVALELMGDSAQLLPPHILEEVVRAIIQYFREEERKEAVSLDEFTRALATALRRFGFEVQVDLEEPRSCAAPPSAAQPAPAPVGRLDLAALCSETAVGGELFFFRRLEEAIGAELARRPASLAVTGLRACVKRLAGRRRWCPRCRRIRTDLVAFLRTRLRAEPAAESCLMIVR